MLYYGLSIFCLIYFLVIVVYNGIGTAYCAVWILFAAVCASMGYYSRNRKKNQGGLPRRLPVFIYTTFYVGLLSFVWIMALAASEAFSPSERPADYMIVLGAQVEGENPSEELKLRLYRAADYYREHPGTMFVVSGGRGKDELLPEALVMYSYLHRKGMPDDRLLIEPDSRNTYENIVLSAVEIRGHLLELKSRTGSAPEDPQIGIITSGNHLIRAKSIARKQGFHNVSGVYSSSDRVLFLHTCVYECAAIIKDYIAGHIDLKY